MRLKTKLMAGLAAAAMALGGAAVAQKTQFISVLTGGQSGVYYPLGVALAQILGESVQGARATAQVTKASAENMNLLEAGRGELAFALGDTVLDAWNGREEAGFKQPLKNLRGFSATYNNVIQIVASADSGIRTLADLKGKRVSVGAAKSGTELNARAVFGAAGISYDDLGRVEYLPFGESVELIKNRQLDATFQSAGLGVASIRDLASSVKIAIVPVPEDVIAKIDSPVYLPTTIPAGTYTGQDEDVPTVAIPNFLVTQSEVSDDLAYAMVKGMYEHIDTLHATHNAAKDMDVKHATDGMPIPLHPGVERYYREVGVLDD